MPGTIRTRIKEHQYCECETPVLRESNRKSYVFDEIVQKVVELKVCRACKLPIRTYYGSLHDTFEEMEASYKRTLPKESWDKVEIKQVEKGWVWEIHG